jgi:hypothetical protein
MSAAVKWIGLEEVPHENHKTEKVGSCTHVPTWKEPWAF